MPEKSATQNGKITFELDKVKNLYDQYNNFSSAKDTKENAEILKIRCEAFKTLSEGQKILADIEDSDCKRRMDAQKFSLTAAGALSAFITFLVSKTSSPGNWHNESLVVTGVALFLGCYFLIYLLTALVSERKLIRDEYHKENMAQALTFVGHLEIFRRHLWLSIFAVFCIVATLLLRHFAH